MKSVREGNVQVIPSPLRKGFCKMVRHLFTRYYPSIKQVDKSPNSTLSGLKRGCECDILRSRLDCYLTQTNKCSYCLIRGIDRGIAKGIAKGIDKGIGRVFDRVLTGY